MGAKQEHRQMEDYRQKIRKVLSIKKEIDRLKGQGKKIVFTNGCFRHPAPGPHPLPLGGSTARRLPCGGREQRSFSEEIKGEGGL
jgi:hypothetical protein